MLSSFVLTLDKLHVVSDSSFIPDCSLNPVISCVSVMQSTQSEILGFPNQIVGVIAFSAIISVGVLMRFTEGFSKKLWQLLATGTFAGLILVHWLIFQSLYVIGALCLWCTLTWVVVAPIAWFSLMFALENNHIKTPASLARTRQLLLNNRLSLLAGWYVVIILAIGYKFWYYWETLI